MDENTTVGCIAMTIVRCGIPVKSDQSIFYNFQYTNYKRHRSNQYEFNLQMGKAKLRNDNIGYILISTFYFILFSKKR